MSDLLQNGMVALVGAGPGDPGLLTLRGAKLLAQADVVVYDYLSSPRLLVHAPKAEHLYVGKMASKHSMSQDQINALLIEKARHGRRVVRLKGGDPFVFGRGGEECEALRNAGIPYIVVPGITAAIAAPAYAGIPVTHRDFNSSFTLITGHEKEEQYKDEQAKQRDAAKGSSDLDWSAIARLPCVAFYMGVKALPRISRKLIEHGLAPDTPAATIQWGTTSRQRTCVATIATIAEAVKAAHISSPAITIVGRVVSMRETLNWFETRPLYGQTILVTRTRDQASDLSAQLESLGAHVIEAPTIEVVPATDRQNVDQALRSLHPHAVAEAADANARSETSVVASVSTWLIFTSANGVRATLDRLRALKLDARHLAQTKVAVVGEATANAVRDLLCIEPDCVPASFTAEALADELIARNEVAGSRFVLLRADIARPVIVEKLRNAGAASVEDVTIYETRLAASLPEEVIEALAGGRVDWVTFTSSSTARNLATLLGEAYQHKLAGVKIASIGPVTTQTLHSLGLPPTVQADQFDVAGLVRAVLSYSK